MFSVHVTLAVSHFLVVCRVRQVQTGSVQARLQGNMSVVFIVTQVAGGVINAVLNKNTNS